MPLNDPTLLFGLMISAAIVGAAMFAIQRVRIRSPKTDFERLQRQFHVPFLAIALLALLGLIVLAVARLFGVSAPWPTHFSWLAPGPASGAVQVGTDIVSLLFFLLGLAVPLHLRGAAAPPRSWAPF